MPRISSCQVGVRFGRLVVTSKSSKSSSGKQRFLCTCDCGKDLVVVSNSLVTGRTKSCGCLSKETSLTVNKTHGKSQTGTYRIWSGMISRCHNEKNKSYAKYGAKGISVCAQWRSSFEDFLASVGERPSPNLSLDRHPNNKGNYEPGNVRWATAKEQARNMSRNRFILFRGKEMILAEACELAGVSHSLARYRLSRGLSIDQKQ